MFVMSVKMSTVKLVSIIAVLGLIVAVAAWPKADVPTQQATTTGINYGNIKNDTDRITFLKQFGWEVDLEPIECQEIIIPSVFNKVYEQYNAIQKAQGLDLSKYVGKRAKRWTYRIKNYPNSTDEVRANVVVYNNSVICGDVSNVKLDGFMTGFKGDQSTKMTNANDIADSITP
jgi:hypothetical protein